MNTRLMERWIESGSEIARRSVEGHRQLTHLHDAEHLERHHHFETWSSTCRTSRAPSYPAA